MCCVMRLLSSSSQRLSHVGCSLSQSKKQSSCMFKLRLASLLAFLKSVVSLWDGVSDRIAAGHGR